jgi:hypothetical protein
LHREEFLDPDRVGEQTDRRAAFRHDRDAPQEFVEKLPAKHDLDARRHLIVEIHLFAHNLLGIPTSEFCPVTLRSVMDWERRTAMPLHVADWPQMMSPVPPMLRRLTTIQLA